MRSVICLLPLAALGACADVKVVWHHAKHSAKVSLSAFDADTSNLVAQSCSSLISSTTGHDIDFSNVDDNGFGNFTVGDMTYKVHSLSKYSGGPSCSKKYSDGVATVECTGVQWDYDAASGVAAKVEDLDCHVDEDEEVRRTMRRFAAPMGAMAREYSPIVRVARGDNNALLEERTPQDCQIITTTGLVEDGDPHQNYYLKQLSENIDCKDSSSCEVGQNESESFTIGFQADITPVEWLSGGFAVEKSIETGNTYTCGGEAGDTICLWKNNAHTAYRVQNAEKSTCDIGGWVPNSDVYWMRSPNQNNRNGEYYCVTGACRAQGDGYWDYSGPAEGV